MRPSNPYDRTEEKPTDQPRQRSRVRLETPLGAVDATVTHLPRATTDAVIDMARQAAGVAPAQFHAGTIIPMTAPNPRESGPTHTLLPANPDRPAGGVAV
jgi:hypothetical protein